MYIDDPIARALGLPETIDKTDYPTIEQLLEEHPPTNKPLPPWNKGITGIGGYTLSESHKNAISEARLRSNKCTPSKELRERISRSLKGRNDHVSKGADHYLARKVLHIESGLVYETIKSACKALGITQLTIRRWIQAEKEGRVIPKNKRTSGITLKILD
jgi:hypothetical protein